MFRNKTAPQTYWLAVFSFSCLFIVECRRIKRIIGGEEVTCGAQMRVASLRNSSNSHHLCGATILSRNYAVTAAHCVQEDPQSYFLQFNNYCLQTQTTLPTAQILKIIKHHLYSPFSHDHDIAALRVQLNFADTSFDAGILPASSFGISGTCQVYGYGYKDVDEQLVSETLRSGEVTIISLDKCTSLLGSLAPDPLGGMMCAVGNNVDSCQGDSGGPLMCSRLVEGLVSYGLSCNVAGIPGVYVSIGAHLNWLRKIMKEF